MIEKLGMEHVVSVAAEMRDIDRREICGMAGTDDPVVATAHLEYMPHIGACVSKDGVPICVVGAAFLWPGVASIFMFATDRFKEVSVEATRFVRKVLLPTLRDSGLHRLQCHSLAEHTEAHAWIRYCGADREVPEPEFGKNREDYVLFTMSRAALERVTSVGN